MSNGLKIFLAVFVLFAGYVLFLLSDTEEIGAFDKVRASGEINQSVNVYVADSRGVERDRNGNIVAFYARDKYGQEAKVSLNEPTPEDISKAEVVELFGHMHGNNFIALRVGIVKPAE